MDFLKIEIEFIEILKEIRSENKEISEWREIESSDMFQSEKYCGGFDSLENRFTFSFYPNTKEEFWFDFSLAEVSAMLKGEIQELKLGKTE